MEVKNPALAIGGALAVHAFLAAAIVLYIDYAPGPTVTAELDLSSVELSFSDEKLENPTAVATLPPAARHEVPAPKPIELPPEVRPEKALPPDPSDYKFPEPKVETKIQPSQPSQTPQPSQPSQPSSLFQARVDAPPRPRRAIRPEYPKGARLRGEQGNVILEIEIGADGVCVAAKVAVSCGFAELDAAAVKAALAARFIPAKAGNSPVSSVARLTLSFRLK